MLPVIMGLVALFVKEGKWRMLPAAYALLIDGALDASGFDGLRLTLLDLYGNLFIGQSRRGKAFF